jgi:hypothetical protein
MKLYNAHDGAERLRELTQSLVLDQHALEQHRCTVTLSGALKKFKRVFHIRYHLLT